MTMASAAVFSVSRKAKWSALVVTVLLLGACAGRGEKPKPAELTPNTALFGVRLAWTARIGEVSAPLSVHVTGRQIALAGGDGNVSMIDADTGRELWRAVVASPIAAGVGSDGRKAAVVTTSNDLVVVEGGKEIWRQRLQADVYTAPLVAGERVFVLSADRSVTAFDGLSGQRLWIQQRPSEPLVLRQAGVLLAVGDTLVAGLSGRLAGLNPQNGNIRWEAPIASPRGTNDVERLADLVAGVSRIGDIVCARAFQTSVGCVNTARGTVLWSRPANGFVGIGGDGTRLFGTESDGKIQAWLRDNGERVWSSDRLQYRGLTAPLTVGRSIAVGDNTGFVHLLSREDGSLLNRLTTDGTAIVAAPVLAGGTLVVVTRGGGVFGFVPQ